MWADLITSFFDLLCGQSSPRAHSRGENRHEERLRLDHHESGAGAKLDSGPIAQKHRGRKLRRSSAWISPFSYANLDGRIVETVLSMAATRDLAQRGLEDVREVEVILAYNQDENADGVRAFGLSSAVICTQWPLCFSRLHDTSVM
jgi:hypothetical protein